MVQRKARTVDSLYYSPEFANLCEKIVRSSGLLGLSGLFCLFGSFG